MGYNDDLAMRLVFDIETAPLPDAAEYVEPVSAPSNYKDPAKIADYIAEKTAEQVGRCSLDPDLCRIVAIGWWLEADPQPIALHAGADEEADMLRAFWAVAKDRHFVGFNCLGFDLPVLLRRSLYLGIPTPNLAIDKYRHAGITDLQMVLSFNGALKVHGLSFYTRRFGFDVPDQLTGADIATAVDEGRWADVDAHVRADVQKTALLAAKCGCFTANAGYVAI